MTTHIPGAKVRVTQMHPTASHQHVACLIVGGGEEAQGVETLTSGQVDQLIVLLLRCQRRAKTAGFSA